MSMTTSPTSTGPRRPFQRYSGQFRAQVIEAYCQSSDTISAVARAHGIKPDLLQRWISDAGVRDEHGTDGAAQSTCMASAEMHGATTFLPIAIEAGPSRCAPNICIELNIAGTPVTVHWPVDAASSCAAWLREVLR